MSSGRHFILLTKNWRSWTFLCSLLMVGYDMTIGPIDFFSRLRKNPWFGEVLIVISWLAHGRTLKPILPSHPDDVEIGRTEPDNGAVDLVAQRLAFFDRYLKGDPIKSRTR